MIAKRSESVADTEGILVSDVVRQAVAGKDFTVNRQDNLFR